LSSLVELLNDSVWSVRSSAVSGLVQIGTSEVITPLLELLNDTDDYIRCSAAEGLAHLGVFEAVAPLIELLKNTFNHTKTIKFGQKVFSSLLVINYKDCI